jgi:hypothetical protein
MRSLPVGGCRIPDALQSRAGPEGDKTLDRAGVSPATVVLLLILWQIGSFTYFLRRAEHGKSKCPPAGVVTGDRWPEISANRMVEWIKRPRVAVQIFRNSGLVVRSNGAVTGLQIKMAP